MAILKDTIIAGNLSANNLGFPFIQEVAATHSATGGNARLESTTTSGQKITLNFADLRGATGPIGATGPAGIKGSCGPSGRYGGFGHCGPMGLCGPCGPSGSQGYKGFCGPRGPSGYTGFCGPQGLAGTNGKGITSCAGNNGLATLSTGVPSTSETTIYTFSKTNAFVQGSVRFWNINDSNSITLKIQFVQSGTTTQSDTFTLPAYETMLIPFCFDLSKAVAYIKLQKTGGSSVDVNVYGSWITFGF
jgi:hypothetical protein